ncbi:hypothetical protein AMECASPLE_010150 [Ameca splendens]|uniref:Uncharacterized protein n=1 Tax=Ameca splendens TaxID=208324 RepID=A0ABV0YBC9_9TELE
MPTWDIRERGDFERGRWEAFSVFPLSPRRGNFCAEVTLRRGAASLKSRGVEAGCSRCFVNLPPAGPKGCLRQFVHICLL